MLLEALQQTGTIPSNAKPVHVQQLMFVLLNRLEAKLREYFLWNAACSVALEAGWRMARRKRESRRKLRQQIQICAEFLGATDPTSDFPENWDSENILVGYDAALFIAKALGLNDMDAVLIQRFTESQQAPLDKQVAKAISTVDPQQALKRLREDIQPLLIRSQCFLQFPPENN